jgi:cyclopropane-fatty-acyl-phospholipid synthase
VDLTVRLAAHGVQGKKAQRRLPRTVWHTRRIDAEAIAYHYDVSNDFYRLWLDEHMVYSCGYFRSPDDSLEQAQLRKIDHILTKLRVQPGDRLLDIGCGWGSLIIRAAEGFGAKALGITLSSRQYELARERIAQAGLAGRCEVRIEDYRDLTGTFDRIASVGMFEHVGIKNLRGYFAKIRELLADNGAALNHGITSTDPDSAETPLGSGAFVERYVFPHGELPHVGLALKEMSAAGLEAVDLENLRRHYAITLALWADRFEVAGERIKAIAGERRWRIWRVYLAGCAYGFAHHWMAIYQILAVKAGADALPMTRDYMYRT